MKHKLLLFAVATSLVFAACKKDDDDNSNNNNSGGGSSVVKKTIKEYGFVDSSQKLVFTFQNSERGKLKKLSAYTSGVISQTYEVLFNASNRPTGFEMRALPSDTISSQGIFKTDSKGRIIELLTRKPNTTDTIGIIYLSYVNEFYQPVAINYFDKSKTRITDYHNLEYNDDGNLVKVTSYKDNGSDPLYKISEVSAVYGEGVNPLTQLYYYTVTASQGAQNSMPLYFSEFAPVSISYQGWQANGDLQYTSVTPYSYELDKDNNITTIGNNGNQQIYIKY